jgi:hypothetical protein
MGVLDFENLTPFQCGRFSNICHLFSEDLHVSFNFLVLSPDTGFWRNPTLGSVEP